MAQFCSKISPKILARGGEEFPPLSSSPPTTTVPMGPGWPSHSFPDFFQRTTGIYERRIVNVNRKSTIYGDYMMSLSWSKPHLLHMSDREVGVDI